MANRPQYDNYQRFARTAQPSVTVTLLWREARETPFAPAARLVAQM